MSYIIAVTLPLSSDTEVNRPGRCLQGEDAGGFEYLFVSPGGSGLAGGPCHGLRFSPVSCVGFTGCGSQGLLGEVHRIGRLREHSLALTAEK